MKQAPHVLDRESREAVLEALREVVHIVVEAEVRPEKVRNDFKSDASRGLNRLGRDRHLGLTSD